MQLLIYTPKITPRIKYIFNFIFREILQCDFELTSIAEVFTTSNHAKFSYADEPLGNELFFRSASLLKKNTIEKFEIEKTVFGDQKVPFAVADSALPFDVFAASFYFVSRYEEYLPFEGDEHLRFPAEKSMQFQLNLLEFPVIDGWALILKNILLKHFPNLNFVPRKFEFIPTVDIDRAFHFRASGLLKNTARVFKAVAEFDTERLKNMITTGLKKRKDPFDTYDHFHQLHQKYQLNPIFFFLLSDKGHSNFDVNIHPKDELLKQLIGETAQVAKIGIHPSYASNGNTTLLKQEINFLKQVIPYAIDTSRQHYLKLSFPKTYLQLIKAGINHDYTMGYPSQVGFRAGTCTSFFWYDLQLEKQTALKIHPFAVMDATLNSYLKLTPAQAFVKIDELVANVKLVNGTLISLWHNEALSETEKWKGWKVLYEHLVKSSIA
jgi:hypothetical protein